MGERSAQGSLLGADVQHLELVGRDSFYGFVSQHGRELFSDDDFASLYCPDNGRPSVAPSLLAVALLLQTHDRVSDQEAKDRADFDLRWKVALGIEIDQRPFVKSTLQLFRAQLVIHEQAQALFRTSLEYARAKGYVKGRKMRVALDATIIFGRGAVEDTYNLIGHGIAKLCRVLAEVAEQELVEWVKAHGFERYFGSSLKGSAEVDWDDAESQEAFLTELIADGERVLWAVLPSAWCLSGAVWRVWTPSGTGGRRWRFRSPPEAKADRNASGPSYPQCSRQTGGSRPGF